MTETLTAPNVRFDEDTPILASGSWQLNAVLYTPGRWPVPQGLLRDAGIAVVLAISPVTTGHDPWFAEQKEQAPTTLGTPFQPVLGRPITVLEARTIALEILAQAEEERLRFAEAEARRGIDGEQQT